MDLKVLYDLTYGLYVLGARDRNSRNCGCVINTCFQVTSEDPKVAISVNKNNYTLQAIRDAGEFSLSIIAEETDPDIIGKFGFYTSRDTDKYAEFGGTMVDGVPVVSGRFCGRLILRPVEYVDCGTHVVVIAGLKDTVAGEAGLHPMTYAYYHNVIKGRAPKNAPTYVAPATDAPAAEGKGEAAGQARKFQCDICGYIAETDGSPLPDDYVCPVCKADVSHFKPV